MSGTNPSSTSTSTYFGNEQQHCSGANLKPGWAIYCVQWMTWLTRSAMNHDTINNSNKDGNVRELETLTSSYMSPQVRASSSHPTASPFELAGHTSHPFRRNAAFALVIRSLVRPKFASFESFLRKGVLSENDACKLSRGLLLLSNVVTL